MSQATLERPTAEVTAFAPEPQLAEAGGGAIPPEAPQTAVAADQPPERESFNPNEAELRAETHEAFDGIVAEKLGDVATGGAEIIAANDRGEDI